MGGVPIEKIKEKPTVKSGLKEKVRSAPKELVRRGLDDGTGRLRSQLRDAAQGGQADEYGGDRIEDTADHGIYQMRRGAESLLRRKKPARHQDPDENPCADATSVHQGASPEQPVSYAQEQPGIKTQDTCVLSHAESVPERTPQALTQGSREFTREQGRAAAITQAQRSASLRGMDHVDTTPPAPAWRGSVVPKENTPARTVRRPMSPGGLDTPPVGEDRRTIIKAARAGRKPSEHNARQVIKTAEHSSEKAIKSTQRAAKVTEKTVRTTPAAMRAAQRAVQAACATAKTAPTRTKAAAKASVAAIKAAIAATQELAAAIAAGGWVAVVAVLMICMVGLLIASPFGIFFSDNGSSEADSPTAVIVRINSEYADTLAELQAGGIYDQVDIQGHPPSWADVFAVFAAKTAGAADGMSVAVLDPDTVEKLRTVFWDMTKITTAEEEIEHPAEGDTSAWTEKVLTITVTPRTPDDMRAFYSFTEEQNEALDQLLTEGSREMWNSLLYGTSGEIVAMALSQVGNVGGEPYWSWYGFHSRVDWCACFVSWCANECGYIDAEVIPKFAGCSSGAAWFKARGQWQDGSYEPRPGDLIFFDWDEKGSSGPQDDAPDHVGIVERVENGMVYTVEGNSGDGCRQNAYRVGHYEIWGYGCPIY